VRNHTKSLDRLRFVMSANTASPILSLIIVFAGLVDLRSLSCARTGEMASGIRHRWTRRVVWHLVHTF
jgi:hypothetical protein